MIYLKRNKDKKSQFRKKVMSSILVSFRTKTGQDNEQMLCFRL